MENSWAFLSICEILPGARTLTLCGRNFGVWGMIQSVQRGLGKEESKYLSIEHVFVLSTVLQASPSTFN